MARLGFTLGELMSYYRWDGEAFQRGKDVIKNERDSGIDKYNFQMLVIAVGRSIFKRRELPGAEHCGGPVEALLVCCPPP